MLQGTSPADNPRKAAFMSTLEFFDYLVSSEATRDLGLELADAWAEQQLELLDPAA